MISYGSVCSGIEAASVAWQPLGWRALWFSEIAPFPCAVLAHRFPDIPNHGDMREILPQIRTGDIPAPDVLAGGTPCQAFSVTGRRRGLADPRGQLTLSFVEIADAIDEQRRKSGKSAAVIVWENVPGVLSSADNAFGSFLSGLSGDAKPLRPPGKKWTHAGYVCGQKRRIAWRVLDAQYFGVPQQRRRVFVVASAANLCPGEILFERTGVPVAGKPGGTPGDQPAGCTAPGAGGADFAFFRQQRFGQYISDSKTSTLKASDKSYRDLLFIAENAIYRAPENGSNGVGIRADVCYTLLTRGVHGVSAGAGVRRLTPVEYERLQGLPDNYTQIPWRGREAIYCPDSPRYAAVGNAMAVPVVRWLGDRIARAVADMNSNRNDHD